MAKKRKSDDFTPSDFGFDPEEHPNARAFGGYLRQAPDGKNWRLYLSLDFNDYLEIPQDALIDQKLLASDAYPLAGHIVWVDAGVNLRRIGINVREAQADFLRGEIASANFQSAAQLVLLTTITVPTTTAPPGATPLVPCLSQNVKGCPTNAFTPLTPLTPLTPGSYVCREGPR